MQQTEAAQWLNERMAKVDRFSIEGFKIRSAFIAKYGFAILTQKAVDALKKYSPILEVGAGSGYWSYELSKAGVDIVATDPRKTTYRFSTMSGWWAATFFPVESLTAVEAMAKYPNRALLTCWPDYDDAWSGEMLEAYTGQYVIYVGEGYGGCTGNDKFHNILEAQWEEVEFIPLPQFDGIHDDIRIYRRRNETSVESPKQ